jgi:hypothetical protein
MGLSLVGAMMLYGTVRLDDMVRWQGENAWGIFVQPVAFFLFFAPRSPRTSASRSICRRRRASSCRATSPSTRA